MAFLTGLITALIEWLIEKLISLGVAEAKQLEDFKKSEQIADDDKKKLEDATTDEDRADAAKSINDHTFG